MSPPKLGGKVVSPKQDSRCFGETKTVTSLHPLKMADSVPLDTAVDVVPTPGVRLKNVPKGVPKAVLSDDVKLKLAEHIHSDMEVRHVLHISGKRNKQHVVEKMLTATNEYLTPSQITKATLSKWIVECIAECVDWEKEVSIEEKDGGSKKSGRITWQMIHTSWPGCS